MDTLQFIGYSDLHHRTSHSAGPAEAWAVRPAGSTSQGGAAAGHRIFKQCIPTKAEHLCNDTSPKQCTAKVPGAAGATHSVRGPTGITSTDLIWEISKDPPLSWANIFSV